MNKFFEIDISKRHKTNLFDLINIKLNDNESFQIHYSTLVGQSKYFLDKYKYSEAVNMIQTDINQVKEKYAIKDDSIKNFFKLIEHDKTNISFDQCRDIYLLSKHFNIDNITQELNNIIQDNFYNDINNAIEFLTMNHRNKHEEVEDITIQIENFLSTRLIECIENEKFVDLPVEIIFRIFSKSQNKEINQNILLDFVLKSVEKLYTIFKFIEFHQLSTEKLDKFINFIENQDAKMKAIYLDYIPFDILLVKQQRQELKELKDDQIKTKELLKQVKEENEKMKEDLKNLQIIYEQTKSKLDNFYETKNDNKQYTDQVIVCGCDDCHHLGTPSNKYKSTYQSPIFYPPAKFMIDPSSLLSYWTYWNRSIIVTRDGSIKAIGSNVDGRISSSLPKICLTKFTEISMKEYNGLIPISAIFIENGFICMLTTKNGFGKLLVVCCFDINDGKPFSLDIGNQEPVALFGGNSNASAISDKGEVIYIHHDSIKNSPFSRIESISLPNNERASSVACCDDICYILSIKGRVFSFNIQNLTNISPVCELEDKEIVSLSGTHKHCLAVSNEGRVYGCGLNSHGQLGNENNEYKNFTELSFISSYKIKSAYAGGLHSLFQTQEGKILSCGSNYHGQLLIDEGPSSDKFLLMETTIKSGSTFCIAGYVSSSIFVGGDPPPNTPNQRIIQ